MKVAIYSPNTGEQLYTFALSPIVVENHRVTTVHCWYCVQVYTTVHCWFCVQMYNVHCWYCVRVYTTVHFWYCVQVYTTVHWWYCVQVYTTEHSHGLGLNFNLVFQLEEFLKAGMQN